MLQPHLRRGLDDILRLVGVDGAGQARLDVTKGAGPGAGIPQDHHGGVLFIPALANIGTGRLLTDGDQPLGFHNLSGFTIPFGDRGLYPNPAGFPLDRAVRPLLLLRVPGRGLCRFIIDEGDHSLHIGGSAPNVMGC